MANLVLSDGRTLEYVTGGPSDGFPLVLQHGTPATGVLFEPMVAAAAKHGLRIVQPSRPGYGGSTARPGRSVADVTGDVAALLDELGDDQFVTVGWSGGGPHALACAALLPGRCLAAATVAGVGPYDAEGLDFLAGMGPENVEEFGAAVEGEGPLTAFLEAAAPGLLAATPEEIATELGGLIDEVDKQVLTGEFAQFMADSSKGALSAGVAGWRDDDFAFLAGWGFDLAAMSTPVSIWQGDQDRMVPFEHGQWLAAHVAGATVHLQPGEGHLSLMVGKFDVIAAELAGYLPR
jgi:pimeloyl-ACP methyl ester carboxylesterase